MRVRKKNVLEIFILCIVVFVFVPAVSQINAAGRTKLSNSKITIFVGEKQKIKLKNNRKKVIWKVIAGKKNVSLKHRGKMSVTVIAKKRGTAKVQAKIGKKKFRCKVVVKNKKKKVQIHVNGQAFKITLYHNEAARQLTKKLPFTITMKEMNGNEKYYYFNENFATSSSRPYMIHKGDLMLYGSDCLVLFYEDFKTSYSYTPLGFMEKTDELKRALGTGNVNVKFQLAEK